MSTSQIYRGDPRPCMPFHVMASSAMGSNWGSSGFADHKRKTNASTIFTCHAEFYVCLSSCSDRSRCKWHAHPTNHCYFDCGKTWRPPIWAPCRDQNGAGSRISLYICGLLPPLIQPFCHYLPKTISLDKEFNTTVPLDFLLFFSLFTVNEFNSESDSTLPIWIEHMCEIKSILRYHSHWIVVCKDFEKKKNPTKSENF